MDSTTHSVKVRTHTEYIESSEVRRVACQIMGETIMMDEIIRIDMDTRTVRVTGVKPEWTGLAGRALTSRLILEEVAPTCHPLSRANKWVMSPGLLGWTMAANSGRLSVGTKSPLTGTIKESNAGGVVAHKLARLGVRALVVEGKPAKSEGFYLVYVGKKGPELFPADEYTGKGNYEVVEKLQRRFGKKVGVILIGPAGEMRLTGACTSVSDPEGRPSRAAGRGGTGAVLGSKKVKAIVVDDDGAERRQPADPEKFKEANKTWAEILHNHPVTGQGLPAYGTNILLNIINEAGALPTQNFREGRFEHACDISGEHMVELINARGGKTGEGCHPGCVIRCSQTYVDQDGNYVTSGLEYETVWALGANCLIKDLDDIAAMDRVCDDVGLDTIEMGVSLAVAMDGGVLPWGDGKAAVALLEKVPSGDPLARLIGCGAKVTGQVYGIERIPVVKGQALPAYDPRAVKGVGLTFATSPMGADHTAGYGVASNILKVGGFVDPLKKEGNVELSRNLQIATAAIDSLGLCLFVAFAVLDNPKAMPTIVDMINAAYGTGVKPADIARLGKAVLKDERDFNHAAGFTRAHDRLPDFFKERMAPHNTNWDFEDSEVDSVFGIEG